MLLLLLMLKTSRREEPHLEVQDTMLLFWSILISKLLLLLWFLLSNITWVALSRSLLKESWVHRGDIRADVSENSPYPGILFYKPYLLILKQWWWVEGWFLKLCSFSRCCCWCSCYCHCWSWWGWYCHCWSWWGWYCHCNPDRPIACAWETWLEWTFLAKNIQKRALAISLGKKSNLIRKKHNNLWFGILKINWGSRATFSGEGREKKSGGEEEGEGEGSEHLGDCSNLTGQCNWWIVV